MTMTDALDGVRKWASSVSVALTIALILGGLNLHGDVQKSAMRVEAVTVLAQATDTREQALERSVAGVNAQLEGLRRDIDKVGNALEDNAKQAAQDRSLILQELGRLQGKTDNNGQRR